MCMRCAKDDLMAGDIELFFNIGCDRSRHLASDTNRIDRNKHMGLGGGRMLYRNCTRE